MKLGRNDPCSCGSGKKYKRCCMDSTSKQHAEMCDDITHTAAMNPNLSLDELNLVAQHKVAEQNNRARADFCGLSSSQLSNWLYAPFSELANVTINIPSNLSTSPVMRYLGLILDEAMQHDGAFKATSRGNLPAKLVKQASDLLPGFAVAEYQTVASISEYTGSNEDKFNALHYTRILAEIAGIIVPKNGHFQVNKTAQKQYQTQGLQAFFLPMLEVAITKYNWGYFDSGTEDSDLRTFWLFMLWRLQSHGAIDKLIEEVAVAFPDLLRQFSSTNYYTPQEQLGSLIELRFIKRFSQFWGFITVDPKRFAGKERLPRKANIQPLLIQTFQFTVKGQ